MRMDLGVLKQLAVFMVILIILSVGSHFFQINLMIREEAYPSAVRYLRESESFVRIGEIKGTRLSLVSLLRYSPPDEEGGGIYRSARVRIVLNASGGDFLVSMDMKEEVEGNWSVRNVVVEECGALNCLM